MWLKILILFCVISSCACGVSNVSNYVEIIKERIKNDENKECYKYLVHIFVDSILEGEQWPWQMIDATGKFPSGLLKGNIFEFGNFDECIGIKETNKYGNVEGKYCLGTIPLNSSSSRTLFPTPTSRSAVEDGVAALNFMWGICVPHVCSADDLNFLFFNSAIFSEPFCQTKSTQSDLDTGDYVAIGLLSFFVSLLLTSTCYDIYLQYFEKRANSEILLAFSILTNGRKLFHVSDKSNDSQLTCLSGIRSISMMWVILGHGFETKMWTPMSNSLELLDWYDRKENMFIIGGTVSVDTFFLMAGLVIVYVYMSKRQMGILDIPYYYLHRYLRLTPALAALIGIIVTLMKHFGDGPYWPFSSVIMIDNCKNYWWAALLYVQNYVHSDRQCVGQSWYLAVDTQLFFLSPLILIPLKKYGKLTLSAICILTCASMGAAFYVGWHYEMGALIDATVGDHHFLDKYYYPMHTRAAPWLIGLGAGYVIYKHKKEKPFKLTWQIILLLWIISLTIMCVCVFCGHDLMANPDRGWNSIHIAFVRPAWSLGVAWVIYACTMGYGGPINTFLSLPVFQILGRLSYTMYLVHMVILTIFALNIRAPIHFSNGNELFIFWANFILTMFMAIVWTLTFESPVMVIENALKNGAASHKTPQVEDIRKDIEGQNQNINTIPRIKLH